MGLDMYFEAELYVAGKYEHRNVKGKCKFTIGKEDDMKKYDISLADISSITLEIGYWRKANAIHAWFVNNVQDGVDECQRSLVSRDKLEALKQLCNEVLENPESAPSKLPAKSGFFFGDISYGEYYIEDLRETVKIVDKALNLPIEYDLYYRASW